MNHFENEHAKLLFNNTEKLMNESKQEEDSNKCICPLCGKQVDKDRLFSAEPLYDESVCLECNIKTILPYRYAYLALKDRKYTDRLTGNTIPIYLSHSVEILYNNTADFSIEVLLALASHLCYEYDCFSDDCPEDDLDFVEDLQEDNDYTTYETHNMGKLMVATDQERTATIICFDDEFQYGIDFKEEFFKNEFSNDLPY